MELLDDLGDPVELVGGHLVDPIEPVAVEQVRVRAPREERLLLGVVVGEVVLGHANGQALVEVAPKLARERVAPVLEVPRDVDLMEVARRDKGRAAREPFGKNLQLRVLGERRGIDGGVARVRHVVDLVEAVGEEVVLVAQPLLEDAEELRAEGLLGDAVEVPQRAERSPAQEHRGEHVGLRPVHDTAELVPVVDVLELHLLHRGARDDEPVVVVVLEHIKSVVELHEMVRRDVRRLVGAHAHEIAAHLQRRLRDEAQNLRLGLDLGRHKVQDDDLKGADLLPLGHVLLQREDALLVQELLGGQAVGNVDGHGARYLSGALAAANGTAPPPNAPVGPPPAYTDNFSSIAADPIAMPGRKGCPSGTVG